jgi:hypothetical protein
MYVYSPPLYLIFSHSLGSRWQLAAASFVACRIVLHMHCEATTQHSGDLPHLDTCMGGAGSHGQDPDGMPTEPEGFAFTTFSPGVEFEENNLPDA